ncbi:MAG: Maf family protein [Victivallaceae bacterium]|nr:Maf family protein [Victivallaceae bacterium]
MLLLASESPRRKALLTAAGVEFRTAPVAVNELKLADSPESLVRLNARLKAEAAALRHPHDLAIGADTVVADGGRCIGKPVDMADAKRILLGLAGRTHRVLTGVALRRMEPEADRDWVETTWVTFRDFDCPVVDRYLELVNVLDKAGAYAAQEHGDLLIERIEGDINNVVGLPLERLLRELALLQ